MQHFLLSAAARSISLKAVFKMGEDKAYETFCQLRWRITAPTSTKAVAHMTVQMSALLALAING